MYDWLKHHFIPHSGNDYKPHLLEEVAMFGLFSLVLISFAVANFQSLLWISSEWMVSTILPAVIVAETNEERLDDDLQLLTRSDVLDEAARLKAEHMAEGEYFAHYAPDGTSPWHWFGEVDYDYLHAGENLAIHFTDSSDVVEAWMDSPTHRENILNGDYYEIGIGTAEGKYQGNNTVYVVQLFGTPRARVLANAERVTPVAPTTEAAELPSEPIVTEGGTVLSAEEETKTKEEVLRLAQALVEEMSEPEEDIEELIEAEVVSEAEDVFVESEVIENPISDEITEDIPTAIAIAIGDGDEERTPPIPHDTLEHLSTSTVGTIGYTVPVATGGETTEPNLAFLTQPYKVLQFLYVLIGFAVAITLALSILVEFRRQHPIHVAYSTSLMALMALLLYVHITVSSGVIIA